MPVLAFANLKGGVAKTTNAVAVAETLASRGYRVLVVDADHQCTASELLLGEARMLKAERQRFTLHDLMVAMVRPTFDADYFGSFIVHGEGGARDVRQFLSVLPSSYRIDEFSTNLARARRGMLTKEFAALWRKRRSAMSRWLQSTFDFTIIDCPPSLPAHVKFLTRISDGIIVPCVPDHLSVRGALHFDKRLQDRGITTRVIGTLFTLFRQQVERHQRVVDLAKKRLSLPGRLARPFNTVIPNAAALLAASDPEQAFAPLKQKYTPPFAVRYATLCDELQERVGAPWPRPTGSARQVELSLGVDE